MARNSNTWQPGQSGNPGGATSEMKKLTAEVRLIALKACPGIIKRFVDCIEGESLIDKQQFNIMRELLDRGLGKSPQAIELTNDKPYEGLSPENMTTEQLNLAAANQVEGLIASLDEDGKLSVILEKIRAER